MDNEVSKEIESNLADTHKLKDAGTFNQQMKDQEQQEAKAKIYRLMGRIEAGEFFKKFIDVTTLHFYMQVKEEKLYKLIPSIGTWVEFCKQIAGCSREKVDRDLLILADLGTELMELSQKMGLGYRHLRKMRQLPEDTKQKLLEAGSQELEQESFIEMVELAHTDLKKEQEKLKTFSKKVGREIEQLKIENTVLKEDRKQLDALKGKITVPEEYMEQFSKLEKHLSEASLIVNALPDEVIKKDFNVKLKVNQAVVQMETMVNDLMMRIRGLMEI